MKNIFSAAFLFCFLLFSCTKETAMNCPTGDKEAPVIKIISPTQPPGLYPGDYMQVKAVITDNRMISSVAWEAREAASVCGNNPYKGEFIPMTSVFELNISFLVPTHYAGNRVIRVYAVDNSGNFTITDVDFIASN